MTNTPSGQDTPETLFCRLLQTSLGNGAFEKLILSRPACRSVKRAVGKCFVKKNALFVQLETFLTDGKVFHENFPVQEAPEKLLLKISEGYRQADLFTRKGSCELLISEKGKRTLRGGNALLQAFAATEEPPELRPTAAHDREKHYLLTGEGAERFLTRLGVCDAQGRVFDKKRAKYRQINRFLEIVEDIYPSLPKDGPLRVFDLCCGKSYLTFAVYYYLTTVKGRQVEMTGVDRKADVLAFCEKTAVELGFSGMRFLAMDIADFHPDLPPHLVISLHACDIATDIVLAAAVSLHAEVILSTPCCHHEMMRQIHCAELSFLTEHSILKQKLCDGRYRRSSRTASHGIGLRSHGNGAY